MQPNRASRRPIIEIDINEVVQGSYNPRTSTRQSNQTRLRALVREFIDVFATKMRREPAAVEPMKIVIDEDKWRLPCNRQPSRRHSEEKQKEIRKQVDALLKLGVIKKPKAYTEGASQKWRFTLDFVRLNAATGGLEG